MKLLKTYLLIKPKFFYSNDQGVTPFLIRFQLASAAKNKLKVHQYRRKDYTEDPVFYPYTREREETDTEYERKVQIHSGGYINEKFTEEGDPIHDMGIGVEQQVKNFMKSIRLGKEVLSREKDLMIFKNT